jgi:Ca2+-binding RTX toxin-like protein
LGSPGDDDVVISMRDGAPHVRSAKGPLSVGPGCEHEGGATDVAVCHLNHPLRYVTAYGGEGNDRIRLAGDFPVVMTAHVNGGDGDDVLHGSDGEDVLFTGPTGKDELHGEGGDDALLSESTPEDRRQKNADLYHGGRDLLDGGDGNDQLVADYVCAGHTFKGGDGYDIAGFRRAEKDSIWAQLRGPVADEHRQAFFGRAFQPARCGGDRFADLATHLEGDLEIFESGMAKDCLYGNDDDNWFVAWGGDDFIKGYGGRDGIRAGDGNDTLIGGEGADTLRGMAGADAFPDSDSADRVFQGGMSAPPAPEDPVTCPGEKTP